MGTVLLLLVLIAVVISGVVLLLVRPGREGESRPIMKPEDVPEKDDKGLYFYPTINAGRCYLQWSGKRPVIQLSDGFWYAVSGRGENIRLRWTGDKFPLRAVLDGGGAGAVIGAMIAAIPGLFLGWPIIGATAAVGAFILGVRDVSEERERIGRSRNLARRAERELKQGAREYPEVVRQAEQRARQERMRREAEAQRRRAEEERREAERRDRERAQVARERGDRLAFFEREFSTCFRRFAQQLMEENEVLTLQQTVAPFRKHMHTYRFAREPDADLLDLSSHPDVVLVRRDGPLRIRRIRVDYAPWKVGIAIYGKGGTAVKEKPPPMVVVPPPIMAKPVTPVEPGPKPVPIPPRGPGTPEEQEAQRQNLLKSQAERMRRL